MAKFMIKITETREITLFVNARKPNGAAEKIQTRAGWREATAYSEPEEGLPWAFMPDRMTITDVKEV